MLSIVDVDNGYYTMIGVYGDVVAGGLQGYFDGQIDEVRLWNKALTQEEIISQMNQSCQ